MKFQHLFLLFFSLSCQASWAGDINSLIRDLKSSHESVKRNALEELGKNKNLGKEDSVKPLLEVLKTDKSFIFQEKAARVLSEHKSPLAVEGLIEILSDSKSNSDSAAYGLSLVKSPVIIEPLLKAIKNKSSRTRKQAVIGLTPFIKKDKRIVEAFFVAATNDSDSINREYAARNLVEVADKDTSKRLINSLDNSDNKGVGEVAKALGDAKKVDAIPDLIRVLEKNDKRTQLSAVKALENYNDPRLVEPLIRAAQRPGFDFIAREYAVEHLAQMGDPQARELFLKLLKNPKVSLPLKRSSAAGLKETGHAQDLIPLLEFLGSDDNRLRIEALSSIRSILARSNNPQLSLKKLADCLPKSSEVRAQTGQLEVKYLLDVLFFGGIPLLTSGSINDSVEKVERVSPEVIKALQDLVKVQLA